MNDVIGDLYGGILKKETPAQKKGNKAREAINEAVKKVTKKGLNSTVLNDLQSFFQSAFAKKLGKKQYVYFFLPRASEKKMEKIKNQFKRELNNRNLAPLLTMIRLRIEGNRLYFEAIPTIPRQAKITKMPSAPRVAGRAPLPSLRGVRSKIKIMRVAIEAGARAAGIKTEDATWRTELFNYIEAYKKYEQARKTGNPFGGGNIQFVKSKQRLPASKFIAAFTKKLKEAGIKVREERKERKVVLRILFNIGRGKEKQNPTISIVRKFPWFVAKLIFPRRKKVTMQG
jgi:hypothetical protein